MDEKRQDTDIRADGFALVKRLPKITLATVWAKCDTTLELCEAEDHRLALTGDDPPTYIPNAIWFRFITVGGVSFEQAACEVHAIGEREER